MIKSFPYIFSQNTVLFSNSFWFYAILIYTGATQNSIKVAQVCFVSHCKDLIFFEALSILYSLIRFTIWQWMLQVPGATSYMGCIGKDKFGEEMKKNSTAAGVNVS